MKAKTHRLLSAPTAFERKSMRLIQKTFAAAIAVVAAGAIAAPGASAESTTWTNTTPITFSGLNADSTGSQYPSNIVVSGQEGAITDVDLSIWDWDMSDSRELALFLVSPSGESEVVHRYRCVDNPASNWNVIFDQQAPEWTNCSASSPGRVKPSDNCAGECTVPGAPGPPYSHDFNNFNNENANGAWRLYAYRDCIGTNGCPATGDQIGQGWSIKIETGPFNLDLPAGGAGATFGPASPYPSTRTIAGASGLITDLNVRLDGVFHTHPDDIDMMLEKAGGPKVMLMSDACGSFDVNAYGFLWNDEAPAVMPNDGSTNICGVTSYRPTDHNPGDSLPVPAPPAPYSTSLSAFDLTDPNGDYRLWVDDDTTGDEGFFTNQFTLHYSTRPRAYTAFASSTIEVREGETKGLRVVRSGAASYTNGSVTVTSSSVSAQSGTDFTPVATTLGFGPGQTQKTVSLNALSDGQAESAETFKVTLSSPTGDARLGSPSTATVTIPAQSAGPETTIDKAPAKRTTKRKAKVKFSSSEPRSTFECKLDRKPFKACSSPKKLRNLKPGKHKFRVRAIDAAGNLDPTPAKARWKVRG